MGRYSGKSHSKNENDNRSNQLNPNNDTYWSDRGYDERPPNWRDRNHEE